jgi:hypothetical protein
MGSNLWSWHWGAGDGEAEEAAGGDVHAVVLKLGVEAVEAEAGRRPGSFR